MKKKVFGLFIVAMLIGGGITYAATSNYYADLVTGQKEQMQNTLTEQYKEEIDRVGKQVHNDMVMYASTSSEALLEHTQSYLQEKVNQEQQERMNYHSEEINKAVEQLEVELREYIDNLFID